MTHAQPAARDVAYSGERQLGLWFGLLGGAFAWLMHLGIAYGIAEFGCVGGVGHTRWLGVSAVAWSAIALTLLTELIAVAAIGASWQARPRSDSGGDDAAWEPRRSTARTGLLTSGLFALAIVFESIPIVYYLQRC